MIGIDQISVVYGSRVLFEKVSFQIDRNDKIGLIGKNGAGKSTLLKLLTGIHQPESGKISMVKDTQIGYLPQEMPLPEGKSVFEEASEAFSQLLDINKSLELLNLQLIKRSDHESNAYLDLIHQQSELNEQLNIGGWYDITMKIEKVLLGLGFEQEDFQKNTSAFSGGWRMRIELAKIILRAPQVILLDEPTNHLDIESIQWLESFLKEVNVAIVLISHDVTFLNKITNRTIEINDAKIYDFPLPYSKYLDKRKALRDTLNSAQKNQQKKIKETEDFINRFRAKNTKSKQVQSRIKMLNKMDVLDLDVESTSGMNIRFPDAPRSGKVSLEVKDIGKTFGDKVIFSDVNFLLGRGEKVAFVGKNGTGKTTLSKILMKEISHEGSFKFGHQIEVGYYAQDQSATLDERLNVITTVENEVSQNTSINVRNLLGSFLFSGDDQFKKVKVLSGGEKARLALCKLLLKPVNFLILDEPTNHLDIHSKEILKQALINYKGSMIIVSHDRNFLSGLTDKVYSFSNKGVTEYPGGIEDYIYAKNIGSLDSLNTPVKKTKDKATSLNKLKYVKDKAFNKKVKQLNNKVAGLEKEIQSLENKMSDINHQIAQSTQYNPDLINQYEEIRKLLDVKMKDWEESSLKFEKISSNDH